MKGNIFSIEALISIILVISIIGIMYSQDTNEIKTNYGEITLISEKINLFYFNEQQEAIVDSENLICDKILYYTDQNIIMPKEICKVLR